MVDNTTGVSLATRHYKTYGAFEIVSSKYGSYNTDREKLPRESR